FEIFQSIYDAEVQINPNPQIRGSLSSTDFLFAKSFLDLYQFDVVNTTNLKFDMRSSQYENYMLLVEILPDQSLVVCCWRMTTAPNPAPIPASSNHCHPAPTG
ncbi:MAG: hypothetical protein MK319_13385, partial [Pseudomonadales bacterium]|nr:hypothetical protein [Pseudomonadales bacterium]